jgi:opacity protein-like surface antigen
MKSMFALLAFLAIPAFADETLTIPSIALDPHPASAWEGVYAGTGVTFAVAKGQKGRAGGDVFAGYEKHFDNRFVLGARFDTGFAPVLGGRGKFAGYDFALASVKLGYAFGRATPYLYAGAGLARATAFAAELPDAAATMNGAFGSGRPSAVTTFGGGVDYRITNNVSIGVSAGVVRGENPH